MKEVCFLNGKFLMINEARISAQEPGFLLGFGLFETMRSYKNKIVYFDKHLERIKESSKLIKIRLSYPVDELKDLIGKTIKINGFQDAYVRLTLWKQDISTGILIRVKKYKPHTLEKYKKGFTAMISKFKQAEGSFLAKIKSTGRILYELAYREAKSKGFDEAILLNNHGYIAEGTRSNLFFVKNNEIFTPSLDCGCLNGITRMAIFDLTKKYKINIYEGNFTLKDLYEAEEAFFTNSLMGIMPLASVKEKRIGQNPKKFRLMQFLIKGYNYLLSSVFLIFALLSGCIQQTGLEQARSLVKQSEDYYQEAITEYKNLIARSKDLDNLYFELGRLYFNHGEFTEAIEAFKKSATKEAKKYLAISYYRRGNFVDALEIFNQEELPDDEFLYYRGLTCEKLNLFDEATKTYRKIKDEKFRIKAGERIDIVERVAKSVNIKDIDPKTYGIINSAPEEKEYPQAGALILHCDERIEITPQYTRVAYLHYIIKILNERGKEGFSETHIDYDSTFEKVELEYARTIKPDGQVVDVGSRHIRDVSKYLNFPLYSNVRVFIISFPEIIEGAYIEYKLKIHRNQLINKKDFVLSYPLQSSEPIINANFSLTLPEENPLHIKFINEKYNDFGADLNPKIDEINGILTYNWQFKDIPQIIPESDMPPNVEVNATILLSSFDSWQEIYNWWWLLARDKIKADSAIKDKVKELIKDKSLDEDKVRAIYNFCSRKIRYVAVEYGQAGYEPHYAEDIFKNKYGDCKDQAVLLITMLKEAGFNAFPVLIATKGYYNLNEDFPAVLFNHAIACVSLDDKIIFLDPTAETCAFSDLPEGDQGRKVLIFQEDGYKIHSTPLFPAEHNLIKQELKIKVNPNETILAQKSIFSFGVYDQAQRFWLLYTQPELIKETLKQKIQEISIGAKLNNYNIENLDNLNKPIVLNYNFEGPEYFTIAGNLRIMPQLSNLDATVVAKDKRRYAIDSGILDSKEIDLEIEIPSTFVIKYIPSNVDEENPWLKFKVEYNRKDNSIHFRQRINLKKNLVSADEYLDFKKFFEALAKKLKQRIVLEKIK
jgi:branched-subunit amino acid aminotransferase/4-amino-4-deoxychorismate lyase